MIYTMDDLMTLADRAGTVARGMGNRELAANSESWAPYYRFLALVVIKYRPHACLELGVYLGTATAHMALAHINTLVIGVDKEFHKDAKNTIKGFSNIVLVNGDTTSQTTVDRVDSALALIDPMNRKRVGLMFVDSEHDGVTPRKEVELYSQFFDSECLVVCDDILDPRMKEFWDWLPGEKKEMHFLHPKLNSSYPEPGFGISIVRRQNDNA